MLVDSIVLYGVSKGFQTLASFPLRDVVLHVQLERGGCYNGLPISQVCQYFFH